MGFPIKFGLTNSFIFKIGVLNAFAMELCLKVVLLFWILHLIQQTVSNKQ